MPVRSSSDTVKESERCNERASFRPNRARLEGAPDRPLRRSHPRPGDRHLLPMSAPCLEGYIWVVAVFATR